MATPFDPLKALKSMLTDGWLNLKTGFGDPRRDKRVHATPQVDQLTAEDCVNLYRSSDILRKIVDEPSHTAFRQGWVVKLNEDDADKERGEEVDAAIKAMDGYRKAMNAVRWMKQFGGGALLVGANDGGHADQPLDEKKIKSIDFLTALDARECVPVAWYANASEKKYGQPRLYSVRPLVTGSGRAIEATGSDGKINPEYAASILDVHESRIIPFSGPRGDRRAISAQNGWGDSIYQSVWQHVADFDTAIASSSVLMAEFAQPVFKIRGLASLMSSDREDIVKKRIELLNLSRSVIRGILVDAEGEDYSRNATPLSGVDGVLIQLANRVATAADYPVSLLFGQSPSGLNATGDSDVRFWYDRIKALQIDQVSPGLTRLVELICLAKDGPTKGAALTDWCLEPNPLWQESLKEQAETHLVQAQADQIMVDMGAVTPMEIRSSRFKGDTYSVNTQIMDDTDTDTETDDPTLAGEGATRIDPATGKPMQAGAPGKQCAACVSMPKPEGGGVPDKCPACAAMPAPGAMPAPALPGATPAAGAAPAPAGAAGNTPADTAMNGLQVSSMIEVVTAVIGKQIPRESGIAILQRAFLMTPEAANEVLGPENFEAPPDPMEQAKIEAMKNPKPMPGQPGSMPPKPGAK